ncbi:cytochrome P450 [Nemania sp. FL0916]|nr:cytochrome P450 [Nemania sp. FL0916]
MPSFIPNILVIAVTLFLSWRLCALSYRFVLHPLRQYPGPSIAKLSSLYGAFLALTKRSHLIIAREHQKYGPVIRIGPDRLTFNSVNAVQDIYQNPRMVKSSAYRAMTGNKTLNVISIKDGDEHRRKRKIISQPIEGRALREFERIILAQIDIFISLVHESAKTGQVLNMTQYLQRMVMDIIGHLAFGYDLNLQKSDTNRHLPSGFDRGRARISLFMQYPRLLALDGLVKFLTKKIRERILNTLGEMVAQRTAQATHSMSDFYSFAAGNLDEGSGDIENSELWSEALVFVSAGGTPPATLMAALLFYLSRYPECYAVVAAEIRSTFDSGSSIKDGPKLASCRYLRACIDETLRLAPPTIGTLWREQDPDDTDTSPLSIDGHIIPKGTNVAVSTYALHHDESIFPDPYRFQPERWIECDEKGHALMNKAFIPFLVGPRSCPGKKISYLETSVTIAKLLWYFDFEKPSGSVGELGGGQAGKLDGRERTDEFQLYDVFSASHDGPNLLFHIRENVI